MTCEDVKKPALSPKGSIVLVGLMGAGKTTIGRRLAQRLALPFVDADEEIERAAGLSVSEIFDTFGEAEFRAGERRVIARLLDGPPRVIATGGGAFMDEETRAKIRARGISIYLRADIAVLAERVARRNTRPLLRGRDPEGTLSDLLAVREPIYAQADIIVSSADQPHAATVDAILAALKEHGATPAGH